MTNLTITTETDSDWIGDIPDNWSLEKLKYIFSEKKSTSNSDLQCGSISFGKVIFKNDDKVPDSTKQSYQEVLEGEFLINPLNLNFDLKSLRIGLSKISVVVSQGYIVLKINDGYLPSYYEYLLRKFDVEHMKSLGQGVRQTISFTHIKDEKLVVPPPGEQELISRYLDKKTEQIDYLVEKIQKKIELLKEQRTSLINQCVTKGLDPNVEMEDSGVEWIGEIPSHWETIKLGFVTSLQQGLQIPFEQRFFERIEDSHEYITTKSIHNPEDPRQYVKDPKKSVICCRDDILYGRTGNTGEVVTGVEGVFHNNFFKVSVTNNQLSKDYLVQVLNLKKFKEVILLLAGTTTIPDLNHSDFKSMKIPLPSLEEQNLVSTEVKKITTSFDRVIGLSERQVVLYREYRQSLISSVVTGKVRVTEDMV